MDSSYSTPRHLRSERFMAHKTVPALKTFKKLGIEEHYIISKQMEAYNVEPSFYPCNALVFHIWSQILTEIHEPKTMYDIRGKWPLPIKIRAFPDSFDTIQYLLLPEVYTEYLMKMNGIDYKEATKQLYGDILPTTHHINMLSNEKVLNIFEITSQNKDCDDNNVIKIQILQDELSKQNTHAVLNITDSSLFSNNDSCASLFQMAGQSFHDSCKEYLDKNESVSVGDVVPFKSENLSFYYIFCSNFPEDITTNNISVKSMFSLLFSKLSEKRCKSLAIPALNYSQKSIKIIL